MNLKTELSFGPTSLLTLVIFIVPFLSAASIKSSQDLSVDRVKRRIPYNPWSTAARQNSVSLYAASGTFKPSAYTVPRPYYIPVYGAPGRPLIYYPPQPIYANQGMPQDNRFTISNQAYLPHRESPHFIGGNLYLPPKETPKNNFTADRLGGKEENFPVDNDDPSAPYWNDGGIAQNPLSGDQGKETDIIPTRAPSMIMPVQPPLVHDVVQGSQSQSEIEINKATQPSRPPSVPREPVRTTTVSPAAPSPGPSNCIWAIVTCCSASDPNRVSQNCFEQRGCPGPFWDVSPCESSYARIAIEQALKYYSQNPGASVGK